MYKQLKWTSGDSDDEGEEKEMNIAWQPARETTL